MQKTDNKLVSVIIPALHRPDLTRRCLQSLSKQTISGSCYETIVVENQAVPGMSVAGPLPENTRVIELSANHGTTGSINRACAESNSKYVLLLNNDVELHLNFLNSLVAVLEQNETYAFATGKLLNAREKDRLDGAGDAVLAGGGTYRLGHNDVDVGQYDDPRKVIAGCGAATLVRRSVFDEVTGLDEDFFAYLDDVDLGLRIHLFGYCGIYVPGAVGFHFGSATLGGNSLHPKIVEWVTRNQLLLVVKDYPASVFIRLAARIFLFQLLWLSFVLARRRAVAYLRGIWGAIRLMPRMLRKRGSLVRRRRMTSREFASILMTSEQQIHDWFKSQAPCEQSTLLKIYFRVFRK
jgi:GT2 family glycosyltransferase